MTQMKKESLNNVNVNTLNKMRTAIGMMYHFFSKKQLAADRTVTMIGHMIKTKTNSIKTLPFSYKGINLLNNPLTIKEIFF